MPKALEDNAYLVLFAVYGAVMALIAPHIFAGAVDLTPMKPIITHIFETFPLSFSNQNITTAFYLLGTAAVALAAHVAMKKKGAYAVLVYAAVAVTLTHVFLGVTDVLFSHTPYGAFLDFFRNANYSQTDHVIRGISRMNGIMPEASAYAAFGLPYFVFMTELWLRGLAPRLTGFAATAMLGALLFSTSSAAYVGLAGYGLVFALRSVLIPGAIRASQIVSISALGLGGVLLVMLLITVNEPAAQKFADIFTSLTVEKSDSLSGQQRLFWAMQGFDAFYASYGLGVGPGSFRSSSIFTAILGSMGVIGSVLFVAYLFKTLKLLRASTYQLGGDERIGVGASAGWAALSLMFPAAVVAPSPNPGLNFGIFCGLALSLRAKRMAGGHNFSSGYVPAQGLGPKQSQLTAV